MLLRSPSVAVATLLALGGAASCAALAGLDQEYVVGEAGGAAASGGSSTGTAGAGATGGSAAAGGTAAAGGGGVAGSGGTEVTYADVVLSDGPIAYWRFGEASGDTAADETIHRRNATYNGAITYGVQGAIVGDPNTAIHFSGDGADVSHGYDFDDFVANDPFTIETWYWSDGYDNTYRHLYNKDFTDLNERHNIGLFATSNSNERLGFERFVTGTKHQASADLPPVDRWHHIVATYDGAELRLYVDGIPGDPVPDDRAQDPKPVRGYMGAKGDAFQVLRGGLDEFAIYDQALPPERVTAHWNAGQGL